MSMLTLVLAGCGGGALWRDLGNTPTTGIEQFPSEGQNHIDPSQTPIYHTDPPTSGPHYPEPTLPGFYSTEQRPGNLVHALEHGNIVIYYDPTYVSMDDLTALKKIAKQYPGPFDGVVVTPRTDPQYPVIATAWRAWLRLKSYDEARIRAFMDIFRGRGPENPISRTFAKTAVV